MPEKSRKGKAKHKKQSSRKPLALKGVSQRRQPLPAPTKQAPLAKSLVTRTQLADHYRYVRSDIRRSLTIGGALIVLLIVLSFFLR